MLSYIYMKILESSPGRYDRGISWLSLGQISRIKQQIANNLGKPGSSVLEIGVGTGSLAILMAEKGAAVTGFDVSPGMLEVAAQKIHAAGLAGKIQLQEMGVSGMDSFMPTSYDLVVGTLVFSELSSDEQAYALAQAFRVLKPGGRLVIADEVRPLTRFKRLVYSILRLPLLLITLAVTQTSTKAVGGLEEKVTAAGFSVTGAAYGLMQSFICLTAKKGDSS